MINKNEITSLRDLIAHIFKKDSGKVAGFEDLPIYHTTHYHDFCKYVINNKALSTNPNDCKVFNEKILYFFYGKAPYWPKKDQIDHYSLNPPITMGYKSKNLENYALIRVFPFDSGGFKENRYQILGQDLIELFELHTKHQGIENFISIFYGSLNNYIEVSMEVKFELMDYVHCIPAQNLKKFNDSLKILNDTEFGEQAFTVELQYGNISIKDSPEVIFVPEYLYRNDDLRSEFQNIFPEIEEVIKYPCREIEKVANRYVLMQNEVLKYSKNKIDN